jgi:hypothetical protein
MKLLSKRTSRISKFLLRSSLLLAWVSSFAAPVQVSSDRFLLKIIDQTISVSDFQFQVRNLEALHCVYDDALVIRYFGKNFIKEMSAFVSNFPKDDEGVRVHMHKETELLRKVRLLFKLLRYSEDQKDLVSTKLTQLIREGSRENKCAPAILHKESLKTNFIHLMQVELYLRSRYGNQLTESKQNFDSIRPSIDLFVDSLDKQFLHEYFW